MFLKAVCLLGLFFGLAVKLVKSLFGVILTCSAYIDTIIYVFRAGTLTEIGQQVE